MTHAPVEFVILGTNRDGKPFRPSGGDHRVQYSPFVHPITGDGVRCVVVDKRLADIEPMAYLITSCL